MSGKHSSSGPGWFGEPERHSMAARGIPSVGGNLNVRRGGRGDIRLETVPRRLSPQVAVDLVGMDLSTAEYLESMSDRQRAELLRRELVGCGLVARGKLWEAAKEKVGAAKDVVVGGVVAAKEKVGEAWEEHKVKKAEKADLKTLERAAEAEAEKAARALEPVAPVVPTGLAKVPPAKTPAKSAPAKSARKRSDVATKPYEGAIQTKDEVPAPSAQDFDIGKDEYTRYMMGQLVDAEAIANIVENKKDLIDLSRTLEADARSIGNYGTQLRAEFDILEKNMKSKWKDEERFSKDKFTQGWEGVDLKDSGMRLAHDQARRELDQELELKKESVRAQMRQNTIDVEFVAGKSKDFMKVAEGVRNRGMIG